MNQASMITIEHLTADDLPELAKLYEELVTTNSHIERMKEQFLYLQANNDYLFLGAKNEAGTLMGSLMGITCYDLTGSCRPFMVVENVIVSSRYQGLGIGKKLMAGIEQYAMERDCYRTQLFSSASRQDAHRFYESIGYTRDEAIGFIKGL